MDHRYAFEAVNRIFKDMFIFNDQSYAHKPFRGKQESDLVEISGNFCHWFLNEGGRTLSKHHKSYFRNNCKAILLALIRVQKIELNHFYVRLQKMDPRNGTMGD